MTGLLLLPDIILSLVSRGKRLTAHREQNNPPTVNVQRAETMATAQEFNQLQSMLKSLQFIWKELNAVPKRSHRIYQTQKRLKHILRAPN